MADTTHELEILARVRDMVSPGMRSMGSETKRATEEMARGADRASSALGGIGKALGGHEKLGRGLGVIVGGLAMIQGNAQSAANELGGGLARSAGAFLVGGPVAAGFTVVSELVGMFGRRSAEAAEKQRALGEASKKAAEEARSAAAALAAEGAAYAASIGRQIELRNAANDAERRSILNRHEREDANAKFGVGSAGAAAADASGKDRDLAAGQAMLKQEYEERRRIEDEKRKGYEESNRADREKRAALDTEIDETLRKSRLTEDELKYDRELKLIAAAKAMHDDARVSALEAMLANLRLQAAEEQKMLEYTKQRAAAERMLADMNGRVAGDGTAGGKASRSEWHEFRPEGASGDAGPRPAVRGGREASSAPEEGGVVDLRAQARAAKRQRARDEHTRHRNANFLAENRERMGFTIDGDDDGRSSMRRGGGDMDRGRGKRAYIDDFDASEGGPGAGAADGPVRGRFASGGRAKSGGTSGGAVTSGGDGAPVDNRGATDGIKSLEDAMKRNEEAMKASAEMTSKTAEAASRSADTLKEISVVQTDIATKSEESAATLGELRDSADKTATAMAEAAASAKDLKADFTKLQEQVQKLREAIGTSQDGG